jgi:hypothetical protein
MGLQLPVALNNPRSSNSTIRKPRALQEMAPRGILPSELEEDLPLYLGRIMVESSSLAFSNDGVSKLPNKKTLATAHAHPEVSLSRVGDLMSDSKTKPPNRQHQPKSFPATAET